MTRNRAKAFQPRRGFGANFALLLAIVAGLRAVANPSETGQPPARLLPPVSLERAATDEFSTARPASRQTADVPFVPAAGAAAANAFASGTNSTRDTSPSALALPVLQPAPPSGTNEVKLDEARLRELRARLQEARHLRATRQPQEAAPLLVALLAEGTPEAIQQAALLELAALAQDQNDLSRAQQIYAQFMSRWPGDLRVPEVLLRQGDVFRQMGLNNMALTKFYAVMTSALVLKNDQFDYYASLVSRAQTEIAETHFQLGKYAEAAEFLSRLLKQDNASLNKSHILYKLLRAQAALAHYEDAVASGQDYLLRYPNAPERAEVQFHLASALKQLGRDNDALNQVLGLLREQRARAKEHPEVWAYWQQRTGNVIANQLYREGDYPKALDIYINLAQLDAEPQWQLPVTYQIGMTYERLLQPQKAMETYNSILSHEKSLAGEAAPSLKAVLEMARWRISYLQWQEKAEAMNRELRNVAAPPPALPVASLPQPGPAIP